MWRCRPDEPFLFLPLFRCTAIALGVTKGWSVASMGCHSGRRAVTELVRRHLGGFLPRSGLLGVLLAVAGLRAIFSPTSASPSP
jgi:hypothetical protein